MKTKLHSLFSVLLLAGFSTAPAQAQQSLSTVIQADGGNYYAPGHSISTKILATGGSSLSNTYAFTGLDRNGATGTMSYIVNAKAVASYGSIGASFSATLPFPKSGPPATTTRVGSPPVCESITFIFAFKFATEARQTQRPPSSTKLFNSRRTLL